MKKNLGLIKEEILNDKELFREICEFIWLACDTLTGHGTARKEFPKEFLLQHSKCLFKYRNIVSK